MMFFIFSKLGYATLACSNFDGQNACRGNQTDNDGSWSNRSFQTPPQGEPLWKQSYQNYDKLVGYSSSQYSSDRQSATLSIITRVNPKYSGQLIYQFDGINASSSKKEYSSSFKTLAVVRVFLVKEGKLVAKLELPPIDFIWNHPQVKSGPEYKQGQKGAIVEMFGWPYADIEQECDHLSKAGYLGVKVFPPQQAILDFQHTQNGELNPWYWVYQPVSYRFDSRMGTASQLRSMINRCRAKGVRVYADAVVNHMAGNGNDMFPSHCSGGTYWGNKNSSGGSPFYSQGFAYDNWNYTGSRPGMEFPAVPYGPLDFHCARALNSWTDGFVLNYGWLVNLADLNTQSAYVRERITDYMVSILQIGFSGFRIDAAKHIAPANLAALFAILKKKLGGSLPSDFITYLEVIIGGEKNLLMCQDNSYNFGQSFVKFMRSQGLTDDQIFKVKIWQSDYPKQFPLCGWPIPSERYAISLDCHDDQFPGSSSRDMGDSGSVLVKEKNVDKHRNFMSQMFLRTDGNWQIKLVLSSYTFRQSAGAYSFPDGKSDCSSCISDDCRKACSKSMPKADAFDGNACGYSQQQQGGWLQGVYTRVHRDLTIIKSMRKWMGLNANVSPQDVGLPSRCK